MSIENQDTQQDSTELDIQETVVTENNVVSEESTIPETESKEEISTTNFLEMSDEEISKLPLTDNKQVFKETKVEDKTEDKPLESKSTESTIDYKKEYERILAPFKANNKEIKVDNIDEAITLMQMGANYNKKMAALKPNLKLIRMLENNNLLDETKINYLIDLDKKNPEAIRKLIKESNIDTIDLDEEKEYVPNTYSISDKQLEVESILDSIKETKSYKETVSLITTKWDLKSKQVIFENPVIIKIINDHMESGIYDQINEVVEKQKILGNLEGLSDIEAYKLVGDKLHEQGKFIKKPAASTVTNPSVVSKPSINDRKKSAAPVRAATPSNKPKIDFNPLALSDEEFEKISSKYI